MPKPKNDTIQPKIAKDHLQLRWNAADVKAARLAAIELDFPTLSNFMLICFKHYMRTYKGLSVDSSGKIVKSV